jgi:spore coat protein U-like protein
MHLIRSAGLGLALIATPAAAQVCTFTNAGLNWGNINLAANTNFDLTGTFSATCTGIAGRTVRICPNFNAGTGGVNSNGTQRYMLNGTNKLAYNIYRNSARSSVWGSRTWGLGPTPPTINVTLNSAGTGTVNTTMYGRVFSGQTALPAGTYLSQFSGTNTQVAYAYSTVGNCAAIGLTNSTAVPFTVQAGYGGACSVSATNLDFGSKGVLDTVTDATNSVSVTCTSGTSYSVSLSGGDFNATDPTQRLMSDAADTEFIKYGIYRDAARSQPWGSTIGTNTASGTGSGSAQSYTAYGRVPVQATPSAQTYTDTIIVTVTY